MTDKAWKVLIIDDDEGIHSITKMVFRAHEFEGQPIQLIHAFSAREAYNILHKQQDIAVILLDVVMETDDAGLNLVNIIRQELKQTDVRIILRTGHPGFAPQTEVIMQYDINDYLSKAELSASRLTTAVLVAIRSYRDIKSSNHKAEQSTVQTTKRVSSTKNSANEESLITEIALHLEKTVERIQQHINKLQQFNHKPMVDGIIESLAQNSNKLAAINLLFKPIQRTSTSNVNLTTELNNIVRLYTEQARTQDWIIDYQIDNNLPEIVKIDSAWLQILCVALIELALINNAGNNIIVDITSDRQRVYISIQDDIGSDSQTLLQQHITERLRLLADQYDAKLSITANKSVSFSFAITL
jgi:response regulator RpfG family c-di-GMP phosphodiesterase